MEERKSSRIAHRGVKTSVQFQEGPCGCTDEASGILPASSLLPQVDLKHSMGIKCNGGEHLRKA